MSSLNRLLQEKFSDRNFLRKYVNHSVRSRIADQLLLMRKAMGLSQQELAAKIGTTQTVVSRLENASGSPSVDTLIRFAEALDAYVEINIMPLEEHPYLEQLPEKEIKKNGEDVLGKFLPHVEGLYHISAVSQKHVHETKSDYPSSKKKDIARSLRDDKPITWANEGILSSGLSSAPSISPVSLRKRIKDFA